RENHYFIYLDRNTVLADFITAKNCVLRRLNTSNAFLYEQFHLPLAAAKDKIDVLHGTDNTIPYMMPLFRGKKVVTIHDTMFIRPISKAILKPTVKQRLVDIYNKISIPLSGKTADKVITVSDYSKNDIIKYAGVKGEKISVIKEGVDKKYRVITDKVKGDRVKAKYKITKPYIMISAAADLRKNTERALQVFNIFNNITDYKYQLVITSIGKKELLTTNIEKIIKEKSLEKYVIITEYVGDDDMVLLYNNALFFFFPSMWEGFGLQVLEAFSCGLPVITSDNTSLKEVAGNAAMFIDPFSEEDMVRAMTELEKSEAKRKALAELGFERVKSFSWKETAQETLKIYKAAVDNER
ncbi:MAG TPA: glycosyltransferase family 1 protein, partial [Candidatus Goldiibacteriota bacterium]|nr:glycosyltransferase family 1 protein [Candidatus Goldiibacteriota bacterium]